jgi:hypothetical protein
MPTTITAIPQLDYNECIVNYIRPMCGRNYAHTDHHAAKLHMGSYVWAANFFNGDGLLKCIVYSIEFKLAIAIHVS